MIQILVFNKESQRRRFSIEFEVGIKALQAWKLNGETDEDFIKRMVKIGLEKQGEEMSE